MAVIYPPSITYAFYTHYWVGVHVQNNVLYLTYIIFFTFLCSLAGVRAHAFPSYFICLILSGSRGNKHNNIIGLRG
jgi:hypothetical protein